MTYGNTTRQKQPFLASAKVNSPSKEPPLYQGVLMVIGALRRSSRIRCSAHGYPGHAVDRRVCFERQTAESRTPFISSAVRWIRAPVVEWSRSFIDGLRNLSWYFRKKRKLKTNRKSVRFDAEERHLLFGDPVCEDCRLTYVVLFGRLLRLHRNPRARGSNHVDLNHDQ